MELTFISYKYLWNWCDTFFYTLGITRTNTRMIFGYVFCYIESLHEQSMATGVQNRAIIASHVQMSNGSHGAGWIFKITTRFHPSTCLIALTVAHIVLPTFM